MNDLEREIEEYIISNNINDMTAKEIADKFYVSRTYLYKVIKKMGYTSYTELKYEKKMQSINEMNVKTDYSGSHSKISKQLQVEMYNAKIIYVIGFGGTGIVAQYFSRQLINLNQVVICVTDSTNLSNRVSNITNKDAVVYFSNTGTKLEIYDMLKKRTKKFFVITKYKSDLYNISSKKIGFDNDISSLSNKYDQENITMLVMLSQVLLTKFNNHIRKQKKGTVKLN